MSRLPFDPSQMQGAPQGAARGGGSPKQPLSVSALASLIDRALKEGLPARIQVVGEIAGFAARTHWYFRLADDANPERPLAVLDCVMFASAVRRVGFAPKDGQRVVLTGRVEFFAKQGRTQFYAERMEALGAGDLDQRLKANVEEASKRGWLDPGRKRRLPVFPKRIAIITSKAGAALHDVLVTMKARCPAVEAVIVDVRVQGEGASESIAAAIRRVSRAHASLGVNAIIVTRGGGSADDLWSFNELDVARAVVESEVPVVAAVGHETDVTLVELVADERCATPTQAAMRLTPDRSALGEQLDQLGSRSAAALKRRLDLAREALRSIGRRPCLAEPRSLLSVRADRLAVSQRRLHSALIQRIDTAGLATERLSTRLARRHPSAQFAARRIVIEGMRGRLLRAADARSHQVDVSGLHRRLCQAWGRSHSDRATRLESLERELIVTSPQHVLARGFSVTTNDMGQTILDAAAASMGSVIVTRVSRGSFRSVVSEGNGTKPRRSDEAESNAPIQPPARPRRGGASQRTRGGAAARDQMDLFGAGE